MGCEILTTNCDRSAKAEVQNGQFLKNALTGQCFALPYRVTDETYIKVRGEWMYLCRAVDRDPSRDLLRKPCRAQRGEQDAGTVRMPNLDLDGKIEISEQHN